MSKPILSPADHQRVSRAVTAAESNTAGEIVTVVTDSSDGFSDVALAWAALVALLELAALAIAPDFHLAFYERLAGGWVHGWSPRELFTLATMLTAIAFGGMMVLQAIPAIRFALVPGPIKTSRVHDRALQAFRVGAEQRTSGRTGVLIYLSMREHRAEVLADATIASKVDSDVWAEALEVLLVQVRAGDIAGGMCAAIERVGVVLAAHFPRSAADLNEVPDRLIEL
jgi:putative membrane protein